MVGADAVIGSYQVRSWTPEPRSALIELPALYAARVAARIRRELHTDVDMVRDRYGVSPLLFHRLAHALCDDGRIIVNLERYGALESVRARNQLRLFLCEFSGDLEKASGRFKRTRPDQLCTRLVRSGTVIYFTAAKLAAAAFSGPSGLPVLNVIEPAQRPFAVGTYTNQARRPGPATSGSCSTQMREGEFSTALA
jgi:hypothetical protein